ncbi:hypothetical protein [Ruminococcus flavefaciens]|uniref:hypothetical protein n=1 Tax=Ruminococcus flavefaciens TaxID=1265 RepID=UPI0026F2E2D1|nr:hypothetical protein [Ruminococcus flavefaciens]
MSTFNFCIKGDADAFGFKLKGAQPPPPPQPVKVVVPLAGNMIPLFKSHMHMITGRITPREET